MGFGILGPEETCHEDPPFLHPPPTMSASIPTPSSADRCAALPVFGPDASWMVNVPPPGDAVATTSLAREGWRENGRWAPSSVGPSSTSNPLLPEWVVEAIISGTQQEDALGWH